MGPKSNMTDVFMRRGVDTGRKIWIQRYRETRTEEGQVKTELKMGGMLP